MRGEVYIYECLSEKNLGMVNLLKVFTQVTKINPVSSKRKTLDDIR